MMINSRRVLLNLSPRYPPIACPKIPQRKTNVVKNPVFKDLENILNIPSVCIPNKLGMYVEKPPKENPNAIAIK